MIAQVSWYTSLMFSYIVCCSPYSSLSNKLACMLKFLTFYSKTHINSPFIPGWIYPQYHKFLKSAISFLFRHICNSWVWKISWPYILIYDFWEVKYSFIFLKQPWWPMIWSICYHLKSKFTKFICDFASARH